MGFFSRLHNAVNAMGDFGQDAAGLVTDLVTAPWNDDDSTSGNPLTVLYKTTVKRGGGLLSDAIGPTGVGGTIAGAFPETGVLGLPRRGTAGIVNPTLDALNVMYRDAIAHPTAAALTLGSLADRPGGKGPMALFSGSEWKKAWEMSMHESPGQAFALAGQTKDILNPTEVAAARRTDAYQVLSGTSDAILQLTNPLNQALGSLGRLKTTPVAMESGVIGKALSTGAAGRALSRHPVVQKVLLGDPRVEIERLVNSGRLEDLESRILSGGHDGGLMEQAQIRDTYFKGHANGAAISDALHYAATQGEVVPALRVMLGHADELDQLSMRSAELASKMDRLLAPGDGLEKVVAGHVDVPKTAMTDPVARLNAAVSEVTDAEWQTVRLDALQSTLREFPTKLTLGAQESRAGFENFMRHGGGGVEDWFQNGPFGTVSRHVHPSAMMHSYHNMQASPFINFDDAASDIQLTRMMRNAKVPLEVEEKFTSDYLKARNATERGAVFERAQSAALDHIARDFGKLDEQEILDFLNRANLNKNRVTDLLRQTKFDGEGRGAITHVDDLGNEITEHLPLWITQQTQYAPIIDMRKVRKAMQPLKSWKARNGEVLESGAHLLDKFDRIWRPAVLLTPGGVVRRIGDEAIRSTIRLGLLSQFQHLEEGAKNSWYKHFSGDAPGTREISVLGESFQGARGAVGDAGDLYKSLASSSKSLDAIFGQAEDGVYRQLAPSGSWKSIKPGDELYKAKVRGMTPWERAVNRQIGQDPIFQHFLAGETPAQVETWLTKTQEGRYLREQISVAPDGLRDLLEDANAQMQAYLPTEELRAAAAEGRATHAMLDDAVDESLQPVVHGELLAEVTGSGPVMQHVDRFTRMMFHNMEGRPTDFLMRNPTFSDLYTREVARRANILKSQGGVLDDVAKTQIENRSRQFALHESKKLFDDYTDRSQIARQLRFVVPFYGAYMQQIARYAGVISSDPSWIRKLQQIWQAPAKAGLLTDGAGNTIDEHGIVTEAVKGGGFKVGDKGAPGGHYITMSLPQELVDIIPGMKHGGTLKLGQSGLNMLTRGLPTFGPLVQMPVNELVKNNPTLAESLKFVLPYGARQDTLGIVEPTTMRHFLDATDENGRLFVNTQIGIFHDDYVAWNLKHKYQSPKPVDIKKMWHNAKDKARKYMMMHTLSQSFVPSSYTQGSPYQMQINAYRSRLSWDAKLKPEQRDPDKGYLNPTEWFLKTFGDEYFPLTESLSHTKDGVPPTLEAFNAQANDPRLKKMIEDNPEYGNLILGADGAGEFNSSVYQYQLAHGERTTATPEEATGAPSISQGWRDFSKLSDRVTTMLNVLGLSSTNAKGAEFIQMYKNAKMGELAGKYPAWFEEYSKVDQISNLKRLTTLDKLAHSKPMMSPARHDMAGLRDYLEMRKRFTVMLASSEFSTLAAQGNTGLRTLWEGAVHSLVERNPAFGALYNRWLSRDELAGLSPAEQAYQGAVSA